MRTLAKVLIAIGLSSVYLVLFLNISEKMQLFGRIMLLIGSSLWILNQARVSLSRFTLVLIYLPLLIALSGFLYLFRTPNAETIYYIILFLCLLIPLYLARAGATEHIILRSRIQLFLVAIIMIIRMFGNLGVISKMTFDFISLVALLFALGYQEKYSANTTAVLKCCVFVIILSLLAYSLPAYIGTLLN